MRCSWSSLLFLLALASRLPAQETLITPETPADTSTLHQWLHSGDPRLIAWAADFARRRHDPNILAEMPELLVHWTMPPAYNGDESQAAQRRAVAVVLDALIQENASVPIRAIEVVAPIFPAQASILISWLPLAQSRVTLHDWTYGATGAWGGRMLARIASMMLAKDPGPAEDIQDGKVMGFVASVVAASEEELQITVSSHNAEGGSGTGRCGDSICRPVSPGWPQVYAYDLVENYSGADARLLVDLDGDRIAFRRFEENCPLGSCSGVEWLDPTTRHRLIAYWLGVKDKEMSWQPVERITIVWTNTADYKRQLADIVESHREQLHATVEALRHRGLLRADEAEAWAPKLVVNIQCDIKPCPLL